MLLALQFWTRISLEIALLEPILTLRPTLYLCNNCNGKNNFRRGPPWEQFPVKFGQMPISGFRDDSVKLLKHGQVDVGQ